MTKYKTQQGDTWDSISYRLWGSEFYTNELFTANPQHQDVAIFSANVELEVPDITPAINVELPPWLRPTESDTLTNTEILDLINAYDSGVPYLLSYRFIDRYTQRITAATKKGF